MRVTRGQDWTGWDAQGQTNEGEQLFVYNIGKSTRNGKAVKENSRGTARPGRKRASLRLERLGYSVLSHLWGTTRTSPTLCLSPHLV